MGDTDSHVNAAVRGVLAPLAEMTRNYGPSIFAVSHLNKSSGRAVYRVTGSLAFVAGAHAVWAVAKDQKSEGRVMLPVKANLAPDQQGLAYRFIPSQVPVIEGGGPVALDADDALSTEPDEERTALAEAMDWLEMELSNGPVAAKQVQKDADANGIAERTLRRAKVKLGIDAKKDSITWYWYPHKAFQGCQDCHDNQDGKLGDVGSLTHTLEGEPKF